MWFSEINVSYVNPIMNWSRSSSILIFDYYIWYYINSYIKHTILYSLQIIQCFQETLLHIKGVWWQNEHKSSDTLYPFYYIYFDPHDLDQIHYNYKNKKHCPNDDFLIKSNYNLIFYLITNLIYERLNSIYHEILTYHILHLKINCCLPISFIEINIFPYNWQYILLSKQQTIL